MSEYYAVVRFGDNHLAHYGVKGMKWGVRKAIERGDDKALGRQYKKAMKKLNKLNKKADNINVVIQHSIIIPVPELIYAAGTGGMIGSALSMKKHLGKARELDAAHKKLGDELEAAGKRTRRDLERRLHLTAQNGKYNSYSQPYQRDMAFDRLERDTEKELGRHLDNYHAKSDVLKKDLDHENAAFKNASTARKASAIAGGVGLLGAAVAGGKALQAKRRTSAQGHAKAVAERDAWKKEMNKAFKGTKYDTSRRRKSK